jgi:hypothetical protein
LAISARLAFISVSGPTTKRRTKNTTKAISGSDTTSALTMLFHMKVSTAAFTLSRDTFMLTSPSGVPAGT